MNNCKIQNVNEWKNNVQKVENYFNSAQEVAKSEAQKIEAK